jgi:hypothetical protein
MPTIPSFFKLNSMDGWSYEQINSAFLCGVVKLWEIKIIVRRCFHACSESLPVIAIRKRKVKEWIPTIWYQNAFALCLRGWLLLIRRESNQRVVLQRLRLWTPQFREISEKYPWSVISQNYKKKSITWQKKKNYYNLLY